MPIAGALDFFTLPIKYRLTTANSRLGGAWPNYNIYPTRDGWLAVAALEPQFWARLKELLNVGEGTYEQMKAIFLTQSADHWARWAAEHRLPLAAVRACQPA